MRFNFNLKKADNPKDVITFFNSSARDFYTNQLSFSDNTFTQDFKSIILDSLLDIERVIRGTFGCDIFLKNATADKLKIMFPTACDMFDVNEDKDVIGLGRFLDTFRNISAHAELSNEDKQFLYSRAVRFKNYGYINKNIILTTRDGLITVAGLLFVVLCMLRQQSLCDLTSKSRLFNFLIKEFNEGHKEVGTYFVKNISKVNLECSIRELQGSNVIDAIVGDFKRNTEVKGNSFHIRIGGINNATFDVVGSYSNNELRINKGSLSKVMYEDDYVLKIYDEESFIEMSNKLPTMVFVDYLYKKTVVGYTKDTLPSFKESFEYIEKLNHPKFYVDKNIDILLLPKTISDFRIVSAIVGDNLARMCLGLENFLYKKHNLGSKYKYSSLGNALNYINIPEDIIHEMKYIRNFACHGYILNEVIKYKDEYRQFTLSYVLNTLEKFLSYTKDKVTYVYDYFSVLVDKVFVKKLLFMKYKKLSETTLNIFETYPNYNQKELDIKIAFIENSYFSNEFFKPICSLREVVKIIQIDGINKYLAIIDSKMTNNALESFLERNKLTIVEEKDKDKLVSTIVIVSR